jgi:hypothetical protein
MTQPRPIPPHQPGTMAQDGAIPRSGLSIPMPPGVKPPPTPAPAQAPQSPKK